MTTHKWYVDGGYRIPIDHITEVHHFEKPNSEGYTSRVTYDYGSRHNSISTTKSRAQIDAMLGVEGSTPLEEQLDVALKEIKALKNTIERERVEVARLVENHEKEAQALRAERKDTLDKYDAIWQQYVGKGALSVADSSGGELSHADAAGTGSLSVAIVEQDVASIERESFLAYVDKQLSVPVNFIEVISHLSSYVATLVLAGSIFSANGLVLASTTGLWLCTTTMWWLSRLTSSSTYESLDE